MQLALSGFLFEDGYRSQSLELADFCAMANRLGYDGVELRRTQVSPEATAARRHQVAATVRAHGLRVTCLTARGLPASGSERDAFFGRYLDLCADLDCRLLKIGSDPAWLRRATDVAATREVTLASNNHVGGPLETVQGTRDYLAAAGDRFRLLFDCLHLRAAGEDYVGAASELASATANVLVHSIRPAIDGEAPTLEHGGRRWVADLPDAEGVQDWGAVFGALRGAGYDGLVTVIESGWPTQRRAAMAERCAQVVRHLWSGGVR